jgi:hypothetical protein
MKITRCDRCGEDYRRGGLIAGSITSNGNMTRLMPGSSAKEWDLCENCAHIFIEWFKEVFMKDAYALKQKTSMVLLDPMAFRAKKESQAP